MKRNKQTHIALSKRSGKKKKKKSKSKNNNKDSSIIVPSNTTTTTATTTTTSQLIQAPNTKPLDNGNNSNHNNNNNNNNNNHNGGSNSGSVGELTDINMPLSDKFNPIDAASTPAPSTTMMDSDDQVLNQIQNQKNASAVVVVVAANLDDPHGVTICSSPTTSTPPTTTTTTPSTPPTSTFSSTKACVVCKHNIKSPSDDKEKNYHSSSFIEEYKTVFPSFDGTLGPVCSSCYYICYVHRKDNKKKKKNKKDSTLIKETMKKDKHQKMKQKDGREEEEDDSLQQGKDKSNENHQNQKQKQATTSEQQQQRKKTKEKKTMREELDQEQDQELDDSDDQRSDDSEKKQSKKQILGTVQTSLSVLNKPISPKALKKRLLNKATSGVCTCCDLPLTKKVYSFASFAQDYLVLFPNALANANSKVCASCFYKCSVLRKKKEKNKQAVTTTKDRKTRSSKRISNNDKKKKKKNKDSKLVGSTPEDIEDFEETAEEYDSELVGQDDVVEEPEAKKPRLEGTPTSVLVSNVEVNQMDTESIITTTTTVQQSSSPASTVSDTVSANLPSPLNMIPQVVFVPAISNSQTPPPEPNISVFLEFRLLPPGSDISSLARVLHTIRVMTFSRGQLYHLRDLAQYKFNQIFNPQNNYRVECLKRMAKDSSGAAIEELLYSDDCFEQFPLLNMERIIVYCRVE